MKSWKHWLRRNGLNPDYVQDAKEDFVGTITKTALRGSTIGDAHNCAGARCTMENGAMMSMIGARMAYVVWTPRDIRRYSHSGYVPLQNDHGGLSLLGAWFYLRIPTGIRAQGASHKPNGTGPKHKKHRKPRKSLSGEMRA
jgi:hypothetical protein